MWIFDWRENFTVNFNFLGPVHLNDKCKYEESAFHLKVLIILELNNTITWAETLTWQENKWKKFSTKKIRVEIKYLIAN